MAAFDNAPQRKEAVMARIDMETYRRMVLKDVESCILTISDSIPDYTTLRFYQAMRTELTHVSDPETWLVNTPDDYCIAVDEASSRIMGYMEQNKVMGFGAAH